MVRIVIASDVTDVDGVSIAAVAVVSAPTLVVDFDSIVVLAIGVVSVSAVLVVIACDVTDAEEVSIEAVTVLSGTVVIVIPVPALVVGCDSAVAVVLVIDVGCVAEVGVGDTVVTLVIWVPVIEATFVTG